MTAYTAYNLVLAALVLPLSYRLLGSRDRRRLVLRCARIGLLMTLIGYPWDFFAIKMGAWRYLQPGYTIHAVPVNDLLFMWICTQLTCGALIAARRWQSSSEGYAKRKNASQHDACNNRN